MYTVNNKKYDYNSIKNQEIKRKLVDRDVNCNVNQMVEYILSKSYEDSKTPFSYDDVTNFYTLPEWESANSYFPGGTSEDRDQFIENLQNQIEELENEQAETDEESEKHEELQNKINAIQEDIEAIQELEDEASEIYEWWSVSSWLAEKLQEKGQCVIEDFNIWGRATTGQAILLDAVISKIAYDMEILEGMKNEW